YEEGEWVANAETGAMEWHAADGTILTQEQWTEQAAAANEPAADDVVAADESTPDEPVAEVATDTDEATPATEADAEQEAGGDHA
ncbi:MAG: hypothetical protein Q7V62_17005, partial [Actinomycetota bacterium]|nr:hypothetical protein [Actinomycetota bacterium]